MIDIPHDAPKNEDDYQRKHSPLYFRFYPPTTDPDADRLQTVSDYRAHRKIGATLLVTASTLAVWHFIDTTFLHLPWSYAINILSLLITIPGFIGGFFAVTARHLSFVLSAPLLLFFIVYRDFTMSYACLCIYRTWVGPLMIPLIIGAEILFLKSRTDFGKELHIKS